MFSSISVLISIPIPISKRFVYLNHLTVKKNIIIHLSIAISISTSKNISFFCKIYTIYLLSQSVLSPAIYLFLSIIYFLQFISIYIHISIFHYLIYLAISFFISIPKYISFFILISIQTQYQYLYIFWIFFSFFSLSFKKPK